MCRCYFSLLLYTVYGVISMKACMWINSTNRKTEHHIAGFIGEGIILGNL